LISYPNHNLLQFANVPLQPSQHKHLILFKVLKVLILKEPMLILKNGCHLEFEGQALFKHLHHCLND